MSRKLVIVSTSVLLATILSLTVVSAQGPKSGKLPKMAPGTAFTYQGQLKSGGTVVNGNCDIAFRLYDAATSGTMIGSAITTTVPNTNGLFTTPLDFGANAFNGDARWLDMQVRCPSGSGSYIALSGRQELTAAPYALALPGLFTQQNGTSPNLIGGYNGNTVTSGVVGAMIGGGGTSGNINRVTDDYGTIGGGASNQAGNNAGTTSDKSFATIGGGKNNTASGAGAFVGGGGYNGTTTNGNQPQTNASTIGGGMGNTIQVSGTVGFIGGGESNNVAGQWGTVTGGISNTAQGDYGIVGGGHGNKSLKDYTTVAGGDQNTAVGWAATVGGGGTNTATGDYATIPGGL